MACRRDHGKQCLVTVFAWWSSTPPPPMFREYPNEVRQPGRGVLEVGTCTKPWSRNPYHHRRRKNHRPVELHAAALICFRRLVYFPLFLSTYFSIATVPQLVASPQLFHQLHRTPQPFILSTWHMGAVESVESSMKLYV